MRARSASLRLVFGGARSFCLTLPKNDLRLGADWAGFKSDMTSNSAWVGWVGKREGEAGLLGPGIVADIYGFGEEAMAGKWWWPEILGNACEWESGDSRLCSRLLLCLLVLHELQNAWLRFPCREIQCPLCLPSLHETIKERLESLLNTRNIGFNYSIRCVYGRRPERSR